jgi:hypothetical protein
MTFVWHFANAVFTFHKRLVQSQLCMGPGHPVQVPAVGLEGASCHRNKHKIVITLLLTNFFKIW